MLLVIMDKPPKGNQKCSILHIFLLSFSDCGWTWKRTQLSKLMFALCSLICHLQCCYRGFSVCVLAWESIPLMFFHLPALSSSCSRQPQSCQDIYIIYLYSEDSRNSSRPWLPCLSSWTLSRVHMASLFFLKI